MPTPLDRIPLIGHFGRWKAFFQRFLPVAGPYWGGEAKWRVRGLSVALLLLTGLQIAVATSINLWIEKLFSALEDGDMTRFLVLVGMATLIIAVNIGVTISHLAVKRRLQIGWREWLTQRILGEWMTGGLHYRVSLFPGDHTNPDGRIAEDIRFTTENAIELGHSLLYAFLLLASFITILWGLSGRIEVPLAGASFALPGHLVWIAVIYAAIGTFIALRLGLPLVRAQNLRQTTEADFRFGLAHTRENSLQVALLKGERSEDHRLRTLFRETVRSWFVQTRALINVFYFSSTWWVLSQVFPILVASPRYIAGTITLGVLMQTAQAFQQVVGAMSWPVDNVSRVAEWRASVERVLNLHEALGAVRRGDWPASAQSVQVETSLEPKLSLRALALAEPDGTPMMSELSAQILPGERVFIAADAITGFRLVRAMAQLWPWGRGAVSLPRNGPVFFVSRHPYLPIGRLKDVLAYPQAAEAYSETTFNDALTRVGLDRLCCDIDRKAAWEEALSADERRRLGIARILIARPNWIVLQEIVETFDPATATHMVCCIADACPGAAIVIVGGEPAFDFRAAQRFTVTAVAVAAQAARRG